MKYFLPEKATAKIISSVTIVALFFAAQMTGAQYAAAQQAPEKASTYVSPVKMAPMTFTSLGVSWDQQLPQNGKAEVSVRFDENGNWSDWYVLEPDLDGKDEADPLHPTAFLPVNPTKSFQYRVVLEGANDELNPVVDNLQFTYINSSTHQTLKQKKGALIAGTAPVTSSGSNQVALETSLGGLRIISRSEWGADEALRIYKETNPEPVLVKTENDFETKFADELKIVRTVDKDSQGNDLTWPQKYPEKVSKIIIHHTATSKDLKDPMKAIRDIYYFHTITRGWGDIGYNYIIDQQGNIYEGRAGGDGVVAAHAGRGNIGSIGIAVLGNYQDSDVPEPVIHSLVSLIRAKTQQYSIDPLGTSMFRGENLQNIMGHRDVMSTSCPGEKLYAQIAGIRLAAKAGFKPIIFDRGKNLAVNQLYDFQVAQDIPLYEFNPGEEKDIVMTLKNSGATSWNKDTYVVMNRDANANIYFTNTGVVQSTATGREIMAGESTVFKIKVRAGYKGGFTALEVFPMVNGKSKVEKYLSMPMLVKPSVFDYQITGLTLPKAFMKVGEQAEVKIELKNTGNVTWKRDGQNRLALGADQPRDHTNKLLLAPSNRLAKLQESEVKPGSTGHFSFRIKAPKQPGPYREFFTPLIEGITWFENKNNHLDIYVYEKEFQGALVGASKDTPNIPGVKKSVWFDIKNNGGVVWKKSGDNALGFEVKNNNKVVIDGPAMQQDQVAPGETAHVTMTINVPSQQGFYSVQVKPKIGTNYLLPQSKNYFIRITQAAAAAATTPASTAVQPSPAVPVSISQPASLTTNIRIGLGYRGNPVITGNGSFRIESNGTILATVPLNQTAAVSYENSQYIIKTSGQTLTTSTPPRFVPEGSTILQIQNWDRPSPGNASINYNRFRGVLEPHWYNNELVTINELPIENYLKGTGEIKDSQPFEKLKSIIVVSRTYALFYVQSAVKFPGAPYHLTDDPQTSQKYVGFSSEAYAPNTLQAIADTGGEVVTYQGKLIKTPYFSSDDGRTRSAEEVCGWKDTPYLISVQDPYCEGQAMNGHGVGLSGCGSLGMAQAGKNYREIIQYYYQGVDIQKL